MNTTLQEKIKNLSQEKLQLLSKKLPTASESQKRLFRQESELEMLNNTTVLTISVKGRLDGDALIQSLRNTQNRHEVLRTSLIEINGELKQIINPKDGKIWIEESDISKLDEFSRETEINEIIASENNRRFDLRANPLWKVKIVRQSETSSLLIINLHQTIFDGISAHILLDEIFVNYINLTTNLNLPLSELKIQYKDFSNWESKILTPEHKRSENLFWNKYLADPPQNPVFPQIGERSEKILSEAETEYFSLDLKHSEKLKELSQKTGVTIFMIAIAALSETLFSYTPNADLIICIPLAGRNLQGSEKLIGSFVNMIPIRIRKDFDRDEKNFLDAVKQEIITAQEHQNFPFNDILEAVFPDEKLSNYGAAGKEPLFRIACDFKPTDNKQSDPVPLSDLEIEILDSDVKFTGCDLFVKFWEEEKKIQGSILYNREILSSETVKRVSTQILQNLESLSVHVKTDKN